MACEAFIACGTYGHAVLPGNTALLDLLVSEALFTHVKQELVAVSAGCRGLCNGGLESVTSSPCESKKRKRKSTLARTQQTEEKKNRDREPENYAR